MKKLSIDLVKEVFKNKGCVLLSSSYTDSKTKLDYLCINGHANSMSYDNFNRGKECKICSKEKQASKYRLSYDYVKSYFEEQKCLLISEEYKNSSSKLEYVCICGNKSSIRFSDFKNGKRCWTCRGNKISKTQSKELDDVLKFFEERGCKLLSSNYMNAHQQLDYVCECGNRSKITLDKFMRGQNCSSCKGIKISKKRMGHEGLKGEINPMWNPLITDEDRQLKRNYPEYKQWVKDVFKRDDFTCQCCGKRGSGNLNAHHLDGYHWCTEKRVDIDNGVTMCSICHDEFHELYGNRFNTKAQWVEYYANLFLKEPIYNLI